MVVGVSASSCCFDASGGWGVSHPLSSITPLLVVTVDPPIRSVGPNALVLSCKHMDVSPS